MITAHQPSDFDAGYHRFQQLVLAKSKRPFIGFDEGLAAAWERYKPRLREHALELLEPEAWLESEIGHGEILKRVIRAIEIQDSRILTNNLVFWQNRYGHANRDHRAFLEAVADSKLQQEIEAQLFGLFQGGADEGVTFDRLSELTHAKYPLLAYLFFLKDMDHFMPIQPTGFDRAFRALGIDFITLRKCGWTNYASYNATLEELRSLIAQAADLKMVRLVDAHSFCWILAELLKQEAKGTLERSAGTTGEGRYFGAREKSIYLMCKSIEKIARNSAGQVVSRRVKNKDLKMSSSELEELVTRLLDVQENRCALTDIAFHFESPDADKYLLPSPDRIDSNGHYEAGNIQIVCQFVNFWKGDQDDDEFKRLLMLVQGR